MMGAEFLLHVALSWILGSLFVAGGRSAPPWPPCASTRRLAMAGVDPRTIQELGGWASLEMVERYTHLSPTHKAEAVERIAQNSHQESQQQIGAT